MSTRRSSVIVSVRFAPALVVIQTQSLALKTRFQDAILFAEKGDHALLFTP